jgi:glucan phosphoethanolaminetransferase (alkaline phosphatase superfamily)
MEMGIPLAMVKTTPIAALLLIFVGFLVYILVVAALILAIFALTRTSKNRREISHLKNTVQDMASS